MPPQFKQGETLQPYPLKKVTFLGMGLSIIHYLMAVYGKDTYVPKPDDETEVWTANWGGLIYKADMVWNTHDMRDEAKVHPHLSEFWKHRLQQPIVTTIPYEEYPTVLRYPLIDMINYYEDTWFQHQLAYITAFAGACFDLRTNKRKKPELAMFGADWHYSHRGIIGPGSDDQTRPKSPWEAGKDNVTWWLQKMWNKGVLIHIPHSSTLLDMHKRHAGENFYGYKPDQCPEIGLVKVGRKFVMRAKERVQFEDVEKSIEGSGRVLQISEENLRKILAGELTIAEATE